MATLLAEVRRVVFKIGNVILVFLQSYLHSFYSSAEALSLGGLPTESIIL